MSHPWKLTDEFAEIAEMVLPWGRPNRAARILNRGTAAVYALGVAPNYLVTLEVPGRRSGRIIRFPLVMVVVAGERYLVSMLGEEVNWVRNVKAAGGNATLRHDRREEVHLEEVAADRRAPVLKAYLKRAPAARAHLPIDKDAPLAEFERVSPRFPVFRVVPSNTENAERNSIYAANFLYSLSCLEKLFGKVRGVGR